MNKLAYRIIFNKNRGMLMAVAENVCNQGKGSQSGSAPATVNSSLMRLVHLGVAIAALFGGVTFVQAQIVANPNAGPSMRPTVTQTASGIPLVQIATPNSAGLSHNQFDTFNVGNSGAILNNARTVTNTQLGGYVAGNSNLANGSASLILNEVTGTSRSQLNGYIEVAGQKAQVVIANVNGITCSGCGFINTSRGVLTTGTPVFGGDGSLQAFRVTGGDIQINGLNAANTDQLDLISRSVAVNGQLWANQLNVVTGTNQVNYADLGVTVIQGDNNKPTVGIDVAQLGGMYANKIRLVGNEAGVGVVSMGSIAAQAGDVNIDNQGKVTLNGQTNATGQVTIHSHDGVVNTGTVYGQQAVQVSSDNQIANSGTIAAKSDLTLFAGSIASTGVLGAGIDANSQATQSGNLNLVAANDISATGQNIAGANVTMNGSSLNLANAHTNAAGTTSLIARAGDIDHTGGNLQSTGATTISASGAVLNNQGLINTSQLTSNSASLANHGGTLNQSGTGTTSITTSGALDNGTGAITTNAQNVTLQSGSLINDAGNINQAGSGTLTINSGALSNVTGNVATSGQLALTASSLNNQRGQIIAAGAENINVSSNISNNQGILQSGTALTLTGANIDNSAGRITSLDASGLTLSSTGQLTNTAGTTASGAAGGVIGGNGNVAVTAANATNSGQITASNNLTTNIGGTLDNSGGHLEASQTLQANAGALKNNGGAVDAATVALTVAQLDNSHGKISADQLAIHSTNLTNEAGQLAQFGSNANIIAVTGTLDNSNGGLIQTNSTDLTLTPQTLNNNGGSIAHAGAGTLTLNTGSGAVSNQNGSIATNGQLALTAGSVNNQSGKLTANAGETLNVAGALNNAQGTVQAAKALQLSAGSIDNTAGSITSLSADGLTLNTSGQLTNAASGVIGGNGNVAISAANAVNAGSITASHNLTANVSGVLNNSNGRLAAGNALQANAGTLLNSAGVIDASTVALTIPQLDNSHGKVTADQLTIHSTNLTNEAGQIAQFGTNANVIAVANALDNSNGGVIQTNSTDLTLTPQTLNNAGGTVALAGTGALTVTAGSGVLNNQQGSIGSNGATNVSALSINNQGGSIFGQQATTIAATQGYIDNSAGGYLGGSQLTVNAAGDINNTTGKIEGTLAGLTLTANSLNNTAGTVQSLGGAPLSITAAQGISNGVANGIGGFIGSAGAVNINAGPVDNTGGTLYAKDALTLQSNGQLTNSYGVIQSGTNLSAVASGAVVNSNGRIEANGNTATMTVSGSSLDNTAGRIANSGTGLTQINGGSQITNTNAANTANLGTIGGNGDVNLNASNLDNSSNGQVIAAGNLTLNTGGTVNNNAGKLYAGQNLQLNQPGAALTNVGGVVSATGNINVSVASLSNIFGLITTTAGGGGDIALATSASLDNTAGTIASDHNLTLTAPTLAGNGKVIAGQDAVISLQGDYANTATSNLLAANRDLTFSTTGNLTNTGNLEAVRNLTLNAANVDNQSAGLINAGNGETVIHSSNAITNTGRIYGNDIALGAQTLTNDVDTTTNQAGVIASRNTLQIGAQQITNREHALIQSLGDMTLGGALDANNNVTGNAASILNSSATIDSGGALTLQTASLVNQNNHFTTAQQVDPTLTTHVTEYAAKPTPTTWYTPDQVTWGSSGDGQVNDVLIIPGNQRFEQFYKKDYTEEVSKTVVTSSDPGKISSAGNMTLSGNVTNDKSTIIAGGTLGGTTGSINNIGATGTTDTVDHMTAGENYYHYVNGHPHQSYYDYTNGSPAAYDNVLPSTPLALQVWTVQQNTQPVTGPNQAVGNGVGGNAVPTVGGLLLGANQPGLTVGTANTNTVGAAAGNAGGNTGTGGNAQTITNASGSAGKVTSTTGNHQTLGTPTAPIPNLVLPNNQLFTVHAQPGQPYLIQTDPKFTNYGNFISSDYMLGLLGINPAVTEKRLGDGFYEEKLVSDQVAQLTGKRFLDGYASNEDEYQKLMDSGVASAKQFQLTPGIALTDAQMASLTSDIVWMVNQDVTLPDGSHTQVLAPVVYLTRADAGDISPTGSLISGKDIDLTINGTLKNGGTLQASNNMIIQATDIANTGDIRNTGKDGTTILVAQNDILNNGGSISGHRVGVLAGRDVTMGTDAISATGVLGTNTVLGRVASVTADQLSIQAGRDVNLVAAAVNTTGDTVLAAGRDLNLTAVNTQSSYNATYNADNHLYENQTQVNGTTINAGGNLGLSAGRDINAAAAYANAGAQLAAVAGHDVNLGTAQQTSSLDQAVYSTSHGMFSSSTSRSQANANTTAAVGSTLSGDSVTVQAGHDIGVTGSNVVGTHDVALTAGNDINITTSQNTVKQSSSSKETSSGMFSSGMSVTMGNKEQDSQNQYQAVTNNSSMVGSTNGNISINAGNHYTQTGSQVTALTGDIGIAAKAVDINAAVDTASESSKNHTQQSGLSLGVSAPIITAVQTIQHMNSAAGKTDDPRMKLLAGATAVGAAGDAAAAAQNPSQGVTVSLTVGSSKSDSASTQTSSTVVGSTVKAGGNVAITATGAGKDSNLNVIGSDISAGQNALLKADGDINLQAAQSTTTEHSTSSSSSAAVGIAATYGSNGWALGITASAAGSRGNGDGTDVTNTNSHVGAGNTLVLSSGHDTNLNGAVASGNQVLANVGTSGQGNLNIQSLQDTSTYKSKDQNIGGTVTIGYGASGSFSAGQTKVNGDYASVGEQSGIKAGNGGFVVNVNGNTDLKGGVIASTATPDKNLLVTQTLTQSDIQNHSSYSASSESVGMAGSLGGSSSGNTPPPNGPSSVHIATFQQGSQGTSAGFSSTSGSSSGASHGGVSAGTIVVTDDLKQQQLTGQTAVQTVASVNHNVGVTNAGSISQDWNGQQLKDKVTAGAQITAAFGQQAATQIGSYADKQRDTLLDEAKQAKANGDPEQAASLLAEAVKWDEGGSYRVAMHTGIGALTGGVGGATGALVSSESMTVIGDAIKGMGLPDAVTTGLQQVAATALGAVVGGGAGAASSLNIEANNLQLDENQGAAVRQQLTEAGDDTAKQIRVLDASCALIHCADGMSSDDPNKAAAQASQLAGQQDTVEQQQLKATGFFPTYSASDSFTDALTSYQVSNRAAGAVQGVAMAAAAVGSLGGGCSTVILCAAGAVVAGTSLDYSYSGFQQMVNGNVSPTFGQQALQTFGLGPTTSSVMYGALNLTAVAGGSMLANQAANEATAISNAARPTYTAGRVAIENNPSGMGSAIDSIYATTRPLGAEFPQLQGVNPHYVEDAGPGVNINCTSCANATQQRLTGTDPGAVASPSTGYGTKNALLPSAPMGFGAPISVDAAAAELLQRGEGATSPVIIQQGAGPSHVITATVQNGAVVFIDGQMGKIVTLQPNVVVELGRPGF